MALSDSLADQITAAQSELDAFTKGHDAFVAQVDPLSGFPRPNAESAYSAERARLQGTVNSLTREYQTALQDEKPKTPAAQTPDAAAVTAANAAKEQGLQAERTANAAKGLGQVTNAEAAQLGIANQRLGLAQDAAGVSAQRLQLAQDQATIRDQLAQGKIDLNTALAQLTAAKDKAVEAETARHNQAMEAQAQADQQERERQAVLTAGTSLTSTYAHDLAPSAAFGDVNEAIKSLGSGGTYTPHYTGSAATPYDPAKLAFAAIAHISPYAAQALGMPAPGGPQFTAPAPSASPFNANNFVGAAPGGGFVDYVNGANLGTFQDQQAAEQAYNAAQSSAGALPGPGTPQFTGTSAMLQGVGG